ncbi:hypothetical protein SAMN04488057_12161 [Cyclobacterium lianum]|uniref:Uncharacterized protein n=1 Tax=Cyclobacterium lianum TaxID=388280 RepID=A0A1M7QPI0_9BACT|nr:hypothetical protein SAMN04488057_12161 [Cyclobacterium lianum]
MISLNKIVFSWFCSNKNTLNNYNKFFKNNWSRRIYIDLVKREFGVPILGGRYSGQF